MCVNWHTKMTFVKIIYFGMVENLKIGVRKNAISVNRGVVN